MLNMSLFLQHDRSFTVWQVAHPLLVFLYARVRYTPAGSSMAAYMRQALSTAAASIDVIDPSAATAADEILADVIASSIVRFDAAGKRQQVRAVYQAFYNNWPFDSFTDIDPNLIGLVLQVGVADGSIEDWRFVYENVWVQKVIPGADDPVPALSQGQTLAILASPRSPAVMQTVLNELNTTSNGALFNGADTTTLLRFIASNDVGLPLFNSWIQQPQLDDGTPAVLTALSNLLSADNMRLLISTTLAFNVDIDTVNQLVAVYNAQQLPYDIKAALAAGQNAANNNIRWAALYYQPVADYLLSQQWVRSDSSSSSTGGSYVATGAKGEQRQ